MKKRAFITGIAGQDGSYLAELLLDRDYEVHGLVRVVDAEAHWRLAGCLDRLRLHSGSLEDSGRISEVLGQIAPDEIYHLGAQTFVGYSLDGESTTLNTNIIGTHHLLKAVKERVPKSRFVFASSCEVFGQAESSPQSESTEFRPRSVYGISKLAGQNLTTHYRQHHQLHASSAILYNHESPRRGPEFVTRKITATLAKIRAGKERELKLGNLDARRDWGHAKDYMEALYLMAQQEQPSDYLIGSGATHSVRDFLSAASELAELNYEEFVSVDPRFMRPLDPVVLQGDAAKAKEKLGWIPKYTFLDMVREMTFADLAAEGVPVASIHADG